MGVRQFFLGLGLIVLLTGVFFWPVIGQGKVALPGDVLVGMYFPWLSSKWGYEVGVPVKNPMLSDPISQNFVWKSLVAAAYKRGELPLWNSYSYAGYPLMANFHSGAFNPFNWFMVWWGNVNGWNLLIMAGQLAAAMAMYVFLFKQKMSMWAAVAGAVTYAYCGFAVVWMELASGVQAMVWVPVLLLASELAMENNKWWRWLVPASAALLVFSGQYQVMIYGLIVVTAYVMFLGWRNKNWGRVIEYGVFLIPGLMMGMVQILPTLELSNLSVRFFEEYIVGQRWGLLPIGQLVTLVAPDFFGNPATGNHWGFWQYFDTVAYAGVVATIAMLAAGWYLRKIGKIGFFWWVAIISLVIGTDTFFGELIYKYKVPVLATGAAGRVFWLWGLGSSVMVGWFVDKLKEIDWRNGLRIIGYPTVGFLMMVGLVLGLGKWMGPDVQPVTTVKTNLMVSVRNSVLPLGFLGVVGVAIVLRKYKAAKILLCGLVVADLFRFGWKFTPFVDRGLVFPVDETIQFLVEKNQKEVFRVERERGEILPPNTWAYYGLSSTSGYDPLAVYGYSKVFSETINGGGAQATRYTELERYDSEALGFWNVKYLLAVKRDEKGRIPGEILSYKIDPKSWKKVFETQNVAVLENQNVQPRVRSRDGETVIETIQSGQVVVNYKNTKEVELAESYYPGWMGCEEETCQAAIKSEAGTMRFSTLGDAGRLEMEYKPKSVETGLALGLLGLGIWVIGVTVRMRFVPGKSVADNRK